MSPSKLISTLIFALSSLQKASAVSLKNQKYPEVIPGPGLPSLKSLGLTSAQLYELPLPDLSNSTEVMFEPVCGPEESAYTNADEIEACYKLLHSMGTQQCSVPSGAVNHLLCWSGDSVVNGVGISGETSSYCVDVAVAVRWTLSSCKRPDQLCAGAQAANGNGNLIVGAYNKKYTGRGT